MNTVSPNPSLVSVANATVASTSATESYIPQVSNPTGISVNPGYQSRLPKLLLPTFSGEPLEWFTFWDSFNLAVNSNHSLGNIEKFNYLKCQLKGEAEKAISGFPLTSENYNKAVDILQERFGQTHKITNAHMAALLDLPNPSNQLDSLRSFYDELETNIRGLEALGKSQDSFGDLLIPIIISKLPSEFNQNLARGHAGNAWTIQQLRDGIRNEMRVLEAGTNSLVQANPSPTPTATFHTGVGEIKNQRYYKPKQDKKSGPCHFFQGTHSPIQCSQVTVPKDRKAIILKMSLCFNCLASTHPVAKCPSKNRCRKCGGKHHTSICDRSTQDSSYQSNDDHSKQSSTVHATLTPAHQVHHEYPIFLKTAVSQVKFGSTSTDANILLDTTLHYFKETG